MNKMNESINILDAGRGRQCRMNGQRCERKLCLKGYVNSDLLFYFPVVAVLVILQVVCLKLDIPGGSAVKNLPANTRNTGNSVRPLDQEDPLEKETATHSSILAGEIPWTEEPGGLQFMGWQKSWT